MTATSYKSLCSWNYNKLHSLWWHPWKTSPWISEIPICRKLLKQDGKPFKIASASPWNCPDSLGNSLVDYTHGGGAWRRERETTSDKLKPSYKEVSGENQLWDQISYVEKNINQPELPGRDLDQPPEAPGKDSLQPVKLPQDVLCFPAFVSFHPYWVFCACQ